MPGCYGPGEEQPQVSPLRCALSKIKLQPPDFKWVAQVSISRPGFLLVVVIFVRYPSGSRAGTAEKSTTIPSASVGWVIVMSRKKVYGIPAFIAS